MRILIALADTDGTVLDRFTLAPADRSLIDGRPVTTLQRAADDIREYIERRYETEDSK